MISRLFVILLLLTLIGLYYNQIIGLFGTYAILAGVILVIAGFGIGYLLGWPKRGTMLAMGFMHGARNASVAVMVANSVFRDLPNVMLMIATMVIIILEMLIPVSSFFKIKPGAVKLVALDLSAAPRVDTHCAHILGSLADELTATGIRVQAVEARSWVREQLRSQEWTPRSARSPGSLPQPTR